MFMSASGNHGGHRPDDGHGHPHRHRHEGGDERLPGRDVPRDRHGNPEDFERYLAKLDDPERVTWQRPAEVVAALALAPGAVACDLGVGPGYFAIPMGRAVGPAGRVHAIDVDARMLEVLARRAREAGVTNVIPRLSADGSALPPEPCDLILLVNAFHHFTDGRGMLRRLASALTPGGRIAIVDFHGGELPIGPPPDHKVSREQFLAAAADAGLGVIAEERFLPYQYFFLLQPA